MINNIVDERRLFDDEVKQFTADFECYLEAGMIYEASCKAYNQVKQNYVNVHAVNEDNSCISAIELRVARLEYMAELTNANMRNIAISSYVNNILGYLSVADKPLNESEYNKECYVDYASYISMHYRLKPLQAALVKNEKCVSAMSVLGDNHKIKKYSKAHKKYMNILLKNPEVDFLDIISIYIKQTKKGV